MWFSRGVGKVTKEEQWELNSNAGIWISATLCHNPGNVYHTLQRTWLDSTNVKSTDGKTVQLQLVGDFLVRISGTLSKTLFPESLQRTWFNIIDRSIHPHNSKTKVFVTHWRQNCITSSFLVLNTNKILSRQPPVNKTWTLKLSKTIQRIRNKFDKSSTLCPNNPPQWCISGLVWSGPAFSSIFQHLTSMVL